MNIVEDAKRYAQCLMQPNKYPIRIPEAGPSKSTLIKTTREFNVPFFASGGKMRYAGAFQPKFGIAGKPVSYEAAFVDFSMAPAGNISPDTTLSSSWVTNINGTEISIDPNMMTLTRQQPYNGMWIASHPGQAARNRLNDDLEPVTLDGYSVLTNDNTVRILDSAGFNTRVNLTPGNWVLNIIVWVNVLTANSRPFALKKKTNNTEVPVPTLTEVYTPTAANTDMAYAATYVVDVAPNEWLDFETYANQSPKFSLVSLSISSSAVARFGNPEYGILEKVRPVAMTVLASCTASELQAAGTCAGMLTVAGMADKVYTMNPTWTTLDGLTAMTMDQAYSGPFKKGTFNWWRPVTSEATNWYDPTASCEAEYPMILIVGECPEGSVPSMKITMEVLFEVQQNTQLFDKGKSASTTAARELALNQVAKLIVATENPAHHDLFGDLGAALGGWAGKLLGTIF